MKLIAEINKNKWYRFNFYQAYQVYSNHFEFEIKNQQPAFFVLLQNHYPLWRLYVNGKPVSIQKSNISFMGGFLQPGTNHVEFEYHATVIKAASFISLIALVLIPIFILLRSNEIKTNIEGDIPISFFPLTQEQLPGP